MPFRKGLVRRSLHYSILDGLFTAMMIGVSDAYLIPYGIALGASAQQVAFLTAVPMLVAALLQMRSASLTQSIGSRVKLIDRIVLLHALAWLPILAVPWTFPAGSPRGPWAPWALLAAVTVFASFGAFAVPAWQSLMSDYIPVRRRGAYFGWRNRLQGLVTVGVSVAAGLVLHAAGERELEGFLFLFAFAMLCRLYAWACVRRMEEPFRKTSHDVYFSFFAFLRQIRTSNFARFVLFVSLFSFSANLSGPLIPVFLLRDLGFDYATYMIVMTTATLAGFLGQGFWGKFGDLDGNVKALRRAGWAIAVTPLLWMVSREPGWLFFVQLFAGCAWGGFNLLVSNFILEAVTPEKRIRCFSYFNVMNSFAVLLGAALGGSLYRRMPPFQGHSYLSLFLLSCGLRLFVMRFLASAVREVRGRSRVMHVT